MEEITTFVKVNNELITALASIGTLISAIVALYTISEIRKQRRAMYKPELFLDSFCYEVLNNPLLIEKDQLVKFQNLAYNEDNKRKILDEYIYVRYNLENLGFGFAKSVECIWEYDYKKAYNELQRIMPTKYKWSKVLDYDAITNDENDFYTSFSPEIEIQKIDFVKPASAGQNNKYHTFPKIFIETYLLYLLFKYDLTKKECKNFYYESFEGLPLLKLTLNYKDIANKTYQKKLCISMSAACSTAEEMFDATSEIAIFYVNVQE